MRGDSFVTSGEVLIPVVVGRGAPATSGRSSPMSSGRSRSISSR